jgi:hypothetical protein
MSSSDLTQVGPTLYLANAVQIDAFVDQSQQSSAVVDFLSHTTVTIGKAPLVGTDAVNKNYVDTITDTLSDQIDNLNSTTVAGLTTDLAAEVTRATAAELVLTNALATEVSRAEAAELVLTNDLAAEVTRATAAELVLTNDLAAEVTRATAAELVLTNALATEVSRAEAAELVLTNALATEVSRAEAAELVLTNDLAAEVTRAEAAELVLTNDLAAEVTRATAAELVLTNDLAAEVTRATAAELVLTTGLATEVTDRQVADANIRATTIRDTKIMPMDITVYADCEKPIAKELVSGLSLAALNYDGWYFRNNELGKKINWYVGTHPNTTLGDIKSLMVDNLVIKKSSTICLSVYTARTNSPGEVVPDGGDNWYKSRMNYVVSVSDNDSLVELQSYRFVAKLDETAPDIPAPDNHPIVNLVLDEANSYYKDGNNNSVNNANDKILFFTIVSYSTVAAGNFEFIVKNFSFQTVNGVYDHIFTDSSVAAKFYAEKIQALYSYFFHKNIIGDDSSFLPTA